MTTLGRGEYRGYAGSTSDMAGRTSSILLLAKTYLVSALCKPTVLCIHICVCVYIYICTHRDTQQLFCVAKMSATSPTTSPIGNPCKIRQMPDGLLGLSLTPREDRNQSRRPDQLQISGAKCVEDFKNLQKWGGWFQAGCC